MKNKFLMILVLISLLVASSGTAHAQDPVPPSRKSSAAQSNLTSVNLSGGLPWNTNIISEDLSINLIQDGSFESYSAQTQDDPYWTEYDSLFGTPLCKEEDCGYWMAAHPYNGYAWAWFGGAQSPTHTASLSQVVDFPICGSGYLEFYFWIGYVQPGSGSNDVFYAKIDGTTVFSATANDIGSYPFYVYVQRPLDSFANGVAHTIEFSHLNTGQDVTFNLDDVSLIWTSCPTISGNAGVANTILIGGVEAVRSLSTGAYTLSVPNGWSGPIVPSHNCFTFSPAMRDYGTVTTNVMDQNYTPILKPSLGCVDIDVLIGGVKQGRHGLLPGGNARSRYSGVNSGPLNVVSTNSLPLVASQRVVWGDSYSEMMGLPAEQLTNEYLFPYYNNVAMDSQLRVSNLGNVSTTIRVYLAGQQIDSYTLGAGGATRKNYPGKNSGPLRVTSSATDILPTVRVLYGGKSYSELMGFPAEQLTNEYLFPYYNNVAMDSQLRVSNLGGVTTTITVYLGTQQIDSYTLGAGGATRKNYPNRNSGPLRVTSSATNILSTIRVLYAGSLSELMGFPANQLAQEYWYPFYSNGDGTLDSQLRISNVGNGSTTITVYLGALEMDSYTLAPGQATRKNYGGTAGPLHVISSAQPILTTVRLLYATPSFASLYEMTGLPDSQLSSQYFFPWYNNTAMDSQLRLAAPYYPALP